ncbi:MAG: CoA transferase, partial [Candidatus Tectomicrobia bacterium]|nr:CoA transferase [Candidatus Tectomicrobia bacterium]
VEHEVPNGPVYDIEGISQDPHYQARGNLIEVEDPRLGRIKMQDVVPKFSLTPGQVNGAGPALGEHNEEVYREILGCQPEELVQLRAEGII